MVLLVVLPAAHAVSVSREVSTPTLVPQGSMKVTLKMDVDEANVPSGVIIEETIPAGWQVSGITESGNLNGNVIKWLRTAMNGVRDMDLEYTATAPANQGPASFSGVTKVLGKDPATISGATSVSVAQAAPPAPDPEPEPAPEPELSPLEEAMIGRPFLPPALMQYLQGGASRELMTPTCQGANCNVIKYSCDERGLIKKEILQCNSCNNGACAAEGAVVEEPVVGEAPKLVGSGAACNRDRDCPATEYCERSTKTCAAKQPLGATCKAKKECLSDNCPYMGKNVPKTCKLFEEGKPCKSDDQCEGKCELFSKEGDRNHPSGKCKWYPVGAECENADQCKTGQCVAGVCTGSANGEACQVIGRKNTCTSNRCKREWVDPNDNRKGLQPTGICEAQPLGGACETDGQCVLDYCNPTTKECELRPAGAQCNGFSLVKQVVGVVPGINSPGDMCKTRNCLENKCAGKNIGEACMTNDQCNTGWCNTFQGNVCGEMTVGSDLCTEGRQCVSKICNKMGKKDECAGLGVAHESCRCVNDVGQSCHSNIDCASLSCVDGMCSGDVACKDNDNLQGNTPVSEQVVTKAVAILGLGEQRLEDVCDQGVHNQLNEAVCSAGVLEYQPVDCAQYKNSVGQPYYCENGRCVIVPDPKPGEPYPQEGKCVDFDAASGELLPTQAFIPSKVMFGFNEEYEDVCSGAEGKENFVQDRNCNQHNQVGFEEFDCVSVGAVCKDGACVEGDLNDKGPTEAGGICQQEGALQDIDGVGHKCINVGDALSWIRLLSQTTGYECNELGASVVAIKDDSMGEGGKDSFYHSCVDVNGKLELRRFQQLPCESDNQCRPDNACSDGVCKGRDGSACQIGLLCASGKCEGGVCVGAQAKEPAAEPPAEEPVLKGNLNQFCRDQEPKCDDGLACGKDNVCLPAAKPPEAPVEPPKEDKQLAGPAKCELPGDTDPCDGKISDLELSMYIGWWLKADKDPMNDLKLTQSIGAWLKG